jgi:hypothetical protein
LQVFELVVEFPENRVNKALIALAINLTQTPRNSDIMIIGSTPNVNQSLSNITTVPPNFQRILQRLFATADPLLAKMVKNLSQHDRLKPLFLPHLKDIIQICTQHQADSDLIVEALGVLGNMNNLKGYSFLESFKKLNVADFIGRHLAKILKTLADNPKSVETDVLMSMVILIGTVTCDLECAKIVANSKIIPLTTQLFVEAEDQFGEEFIIQMLYCFYRFILFDSTRQSFLQQKVHLLNEQRGLIPLILHDNEQVRKMCDLIFDIIVEFDEDWKEQVRRKKFYIFNREWCEAVYSEERSSHNTN